MRLGLLAVFAALFQWAGSAALASPLMSTLPAAFTHSQSDSGIKLVRRGHGRRHGWGRSSEFRDDRPSDSAEVGPEIGTPPEAPRPRRRSRSGWIDPPSTH